MLHKKQFPVLSILSILLLMVGLAYAASSYGSSAEPSNSITTELGITQFSLQDLHPIKKDSGEVEIPIKLDKKEYCLVLYPHSVRADNFHLQIPDGKGHFKDITPPQTRSFRGYVKGLNSRVFASLHDNRLRASIALTDTNETWDIIPPGKIRDKIIAEHIVYRPENRLSRQWRCLVDSAAEEAKAPDSNDEIQAETVLGPLDVVVCDIACDADYEFFQQHNSSIADTEADIEAIINGAAAIYELDLKLTFRITNITIRTSEPDPYSKTNPDQLIAQFRGEWNNNHKDIVRDIAHLFTGKNLDGSTKGIAYLDQVCPRLEHYSLVSYSSDDDFDKKVAFCAHEIGHNFDARHCDDLDPWCRIMCATFSNCSGGYHSFGPWNINKIKTAIAKKHCLDPGVVQIPKATLPFYDDFSYARTVPVAPDQELWTAADRANCSYGRLDINTSRGWDYHQRLGTVRTRPISVYEPVVVSCRICQYYVPSGQSLKIEYFNSESFEWQLLEQINSTGTPTSEYTLYEFPLGPEAYGDYFAVRFSAYSFNTSSNRDWRIDDVKIERFSSNRSDLDDDGDTDLNDFALFATYWLDMDCGTCGQADMDADHAVTLTDLEQFVGNWLK